MWNSNGDLDHATSEIVDTGPMTVSGKIDGNSRGGRPLPGISSTHTR